MFADPAHALEALLELSFGRFSATQPPLKQILALQLPGGAALFERDVGMPWLVMQFQGQAWLSPILWELARASGVSSLADGEAQASLVRILESPESAGLVAPLGAEDFLIHPLLPCLVAHPNNDPRLRTQGYLRSLALVQGLYAHYIQWLFGGSPFSGDERSPGNAKGWEFQTHASRRA